MEQALSQEGTSANQKLNNNHPNSMRGITHGGVVYVGSNEYDYISPNVVFVCFLFSSEFFPLAKLVSVSTVCPYAVGASLEPHQLFEPPLDLSFEPHHDLSLYLSLEPHQLFEPPLDLSFEPHHDLSLYLSLEPHQLFEPPWTCLLNPTTTCLFTCLLNPTNFLNPLGLVF